MLACSPAMTASRWQLSLCQPRRSTWWTYFGTRLLSTVVCSSCCFPCAGAYCTNRFCFRTQPIASVLGLVAAICVAHRGFTGCINLRTSKSKSCSQRLAGTCFLLFLVAGHLKHLQGLCVPSLRVAGFWRGYGEYVIVTDLLCGAHTLEDMLASGKLLPPGLAVEAEKV